MAVVAGALSACASSGVSGPVGQALPPPSASSTAITADYKIAPLDKITVSVFQAPDLTLDAVPVDASGQFNMPLIGKLRAAGKSTTQLSEEIAAKLEERYFRSPQVTVVVDEVHGHEITVEGAVVQPGVYKFASTTTLLQAIAMARGPDKTADLDRVAVFRNIEGKRAAAVFDLTAIRSGAAEDPELYGSDIVVVQGSSTKQLWQGMLNALPLGIFRFF